MWRAAWRRGTVAARAGRRGLGAGACCSRGAGAGARECAAERAGIAAPAPGEALAQLLGSAPEPGSAPGAAAQFATGWQARPAQAALPAQAGCPAPGARRPVSWRGRTARTGRVAEDGQSGPQHAVVAEDRLTRHRAAVVTARDRRQGHPRLTNHADRRFGAACTLHVVVAACSADRSRMCVVLILLGSSELHRRFVFTRN